MRKRPVRIFLSYAHDDEDNGQWCTQLRKHLSGLEHWDRIIELWTDTRILAGEDWRNEIDRHLKDMELFVFLHSAAFSVSLECKKEFEYAERQERDRKTRIVMIRLRPFAMPKVLSSRQWIPRGNKTVTCRTDGKDVESVLAEVVDEIKKVVEDILGK